MLRTSDCMNSGFTWTLFYSEIERESERVTMDNSRGGKKVGRVSSNNSGEGIPFHPFCRTNSFCSVIMCAPVAASAKELLLFIPIFIT